MGTVTTNSNPVVEPLSPSSSTSPHNRFHSTLIPTRDFCSNCSGRIYKLLIMTHKLWVAIVNWCLWCSLAVGSLHDGHWVIEICSISPCSRLPIPFQFRRFGSRMFRIQTSRNLARYQVCPIYPHPLPRTDYQAVSTGPNFFWLVK